MLWYRSVFLKAALFLLFGLLTPILANEKVLVGLKVNHGDIVDGFTPIYRELNNDGSLGKEVLGAHIGGKGGKETIIKKEGFVVNAIIYQPGKYFGHTAILWMKVKWRLWAKKMKGFKYGTGKYGKPSGKPKKVKLKRKQFIKELTGIKGSKYLKNITIKKASKK